MFFIFRRKIVVAKQNYRCAGCGTRIDPGMASKTLFHMSPFILMHSFKSFSLSPAAATASVCCEEVQPLVSDAPFIPNSDPYPAGDSAARPQITSSDCVTASTSAVTSASAAMRTPRRWSPAECWGSGTSASTTSATLPGTCWARLPETRCSTPVTSTAACTRRSKLWSP